MLHRVSTGLKKEYANYISHGYSSQVHAQNFNEYLHSMYFSPYVCIENLQRSIFYIYIQFIVPLMFPWGICNVQFSMNTFW